MSFGPQEICHVCGQINYGGRIVCHKCEEPWSPGEFDPELDLPTPPLTAEEKK